MHRHFLDHSVLGERGVQAATVRELLLFTVDYFNGNYHTVIRWISSLP